MDNLKQIGEQIHRAILEGVEPTNDIAKRIIDIIFKTENEKSIDVKCADNPVHDNTIVSAELLQAAKQYSAREQN